MDLSNTKLVTKMSLMANTALMLCVAGLAAVFAFYNVDYMVYHSIPTFALYILFYILICTGHIKAFFWAVYCTIAIYMGAATVCLGIDFGFNLYCMSLIPIAFYSEYLAHKTGDTKSRVGLSSIGLVIVYFVSTGLTIINGPVYEVPDTACHVFFFLNSSFVLFFLVVYTAVIVNIIRQSENKLEYMAHNDNLTGLYNRHYLMEQLRAMQEKNAINWIAILDIDKFKSVNDTFGHSSGDKVLVSVANSMTRICQNCLVARWGGEEFLVVPKDKTVDKKILESLREYIENKEIKSGNRTINVTISAGVADYSDELKLEKTLQKADEKLYISKSSGRNKVTY